MGDCGKNGRIDSGASAVGKTAGTGPMVSATGFNAFSCASSCKISGPIHVGDKAP